MLKEFYTHAKTLGGFKWLHWNMRDTNYGFPALEHRMRVLGGTPVELQDSNLIDLARILIALFGPNYVPHPRLASIMKLNSISEKDFLTGAEEAEAFEKREYVKLHQSTLRKVDVMSSIVDRLSSGTLKTNAKWREIHGSAYRYILEVMRDHPIVSAIGLISSILGIVGFFWSLN